MSESSQTTESSDSDCNRQSLIHHMSPAVLSSLLNMNSDISRFHPFVSDIANLDDIISQFYQYKKDPAQLTNVSYLVKEQLTNKPYAVISNEQKITSERDSFHLVSKFISCSFYKTLAKVRSIPSETIRLFCNYYPLFYWSNEYISLKSAESSPSLIFIVPKECCDSSGCLRSFIHNESASSSTLSVENIEDDVLELFVRYIANVHYRELHARNKEAERGYLNMMNAQWRDAFVEELSETKLQQLHDAAKQMDCKSLTDLTENRLQIIKECKNHQYNNNIESILEAHFQSM